MPGWTMLITQLLLPQYGRAQHTLIYSVVPLAAAAEDVQPSALACEYKRVHVR